MGGFVVVILGVAGLNFLFGVIVFLLSTVSDLCIFGLVSGNKLTVWHGCLDGHSHFILHFQKGFHFLYDIRVCMYVIGPQYTLGYLHGPISFVQVGPLHRCDYDFHIYHFHGEFAPEVSVQKVTFRLKLASHRVYKI